MRSDARPPRAGVRHGVPQARRFVENRRLIPARPGGAGEGIPGRMGEVAARLGPDPAPGIRAHGGAAVQRCSNTGSITFSAATQRQEGLNRTLLRNILFSQCFLLGIFQQDAGYPNADAAEASMTAKRVIFLGYSREQTRLIDLITSLGWDVEWTDQIADDLSDCTIAISFGYRHILRRHVIATAKRPIINLHIAYLPWNRGAHPLFWAAYDGTPAGVTIHEVDSGIDTGPICFQRKVGLDYQTETFTSAYRKLIENIEALFEEHATELLTGDYVSHPQEGPGSFKRVRDLPSGFSWSETVAPTIYRLKQAGCT